MGRGCSAQFPVLFAAFGQLLDEDDLLLLLLQAGLYIRGRGGYGFNPSKL